MIRLPKNYALGSSLYWCIALLYWEILSHAAMYDGFQSAFFYTAGFACGLGLLLALLSGLLPRRIRLWCSVLLSLLCIVLYGSQMLYCFIFGTPYSVAQMGMGGEAVAAFWRETSGAVLNNLLWLAALLLPLPLLLLFRNFTEPTRRQRLAVFLLAADAIALTLVTICARGSGMYSDYYFLTSSNSTTIQTMERFGVSATFTLELAMRHDVQEDLSEQLVVPSTAPTEPIQEELSEEAPREPARYHALDIDFASLTSDNKTITALNSYISQLVPAKENAYTGKYADYNLIYICAESFSPAAVDAVYTPTLYKLTNEGYVFSNYYNSFPNTTTDGEYAFMQGLWPDSSRDKFSSSMIASAGNYLPYTLGNLFTAKGVKTWGYHNYDGSYYQRNKTHPNMGYEMQFARKGMTFTNTWPASDLEMMQQSVDDYISQDQFHAYYMTFSGHYQYNLKSNGIAVKNYSLVADIEGYNESQKCYLACSIELDRAMEYLLQRLEEAGVLEKTVIVLAGDHFPYGLYKKEYFGMVSDLQTDFSACHSNLILWAGDMEKPVPVDTFCCNVDILPTILNMWGFEYDSRLLPGTDIFSEGPHIAILSNRSFITGDLSFNSNNGKLQWFSDSTLFTEDFVDNLNQIIAAKLTYSASVLKTDYFRYLLGEQ